MKYTLLALLLLTVPAVAQNADYPRPGCYAAMWSCVTKGPPEAVTIKVTMTRERKVKR